MKTLLLSDIHIGDPRYKSDELLVKLLNTEHFDQIVLVGDIIDLWMPWWQEECHKSEFLKTLSRLNTKIVWVIGNHDHGLDVHSIVPTASACDTYTFVDKQKFTAVHGHQVYAFKNMGIHTKIFALMCAYAYKWTGWDYQSLRNKWPFKGSAIHKRNKVLAKYGDMADIIIMGHTHVQVHQSDGHADLYDLGSIIIGNTYGIIEEGVFNFRKLKE